MLMVVLIVIVVVICCIFYGGHGGRVCGGGSGVGGNISINSTNSDCLCGLVVRVSGYRYRGPGFDPRRYQIF